MDSVSPKMTNWNNTSCGPTAVCHQSSSAVCSATSASTTSPPAMSWRARTTCSRTCSACSTTSARRGSTSCRRPRSCPRTRPRSSRTCTSTRTSGTSSNPPTCRRARVFILLISRPRYSTARRLLLVSTSPTHCWSMTTSLTWGCTLWWLATVRWRFSYRTRGWSGLLLPSRFIRAPRTVRIICRCTWQTRVSTSRVTISLKIKMPMMMQMATSGAGLHF